MGTAACSPCGAAAKSGCYKVILDCFDPLVPFYERMGFRPFNRGLRLDLPHEPSDPIGRRARRFVAMHGLLLCAALSWPLCSTAEFSPADADAERSKRQCGSFIRRRTEKAPAS